MNNSEIIKKPTSLIFDTAGAKLNKNEMRSTLRKLKEMAKAGLVKYEKRKGRYYWWTEVKL